MSQGEAMLCNYCGREMDEGSITERIILDQEYSTNQNILVLICCSKECMRKIIELKIKDIKSSLLLNPLSASSLYLRKNLLKDLTNLLNQYQDKNYLQDTLDSY